MSFLPSLLVLGPLALVALVLTGARSLSPDPALRRRAARALALATAAQAIHFTEEAVRGLHRALPALIEQPPIPFDLFVGFNVAWLVIWGWSVWGLTRARPFAVFAAWFLGVAGVVNGIAHPLLALAGGGYFPGLVTAPVIGVAGLIVVRRLAQATGVVRAA